MKSHNSYFKKVLFLSGLGSFLPIKNEKSKIRLFNSFNEYAN